MQQLHKIPKETSSIYLPVFISKLISNYYQSFNNHILSISNPGYNTIPIKRGTQEKKISAFHELICILIKFSLLDPDFYYKHPSFTMIDYTTGRKEKRKSNLGIQLYQETAKQLVRLNHSQSGKHKATSPDAQSV